MLYLHSLRGRAGEYIQDNNSIEKTMLAKKTLAAALQENKEVVGGLFGLDKYFFKREEVVVKEGKIFNVIIKFVLGEKNN